MCNTGGCYTVRFAATVSSAHGLRKCAWAGTFEKLFAKEGLRTGRTVVENGTEEEVEKSPAETRTVLFVCSSPCVQNMSIRKMKKKKKIKLSKE